MIKKLAIKAIFLFMIAVSLYSDTPKITLNFGHRKEVTALKYDFARKLLFSSSRDGNIKIWDSSSAKLINTLVYSLFSIKDFCIHPLLPRVAVIEEVNPKKYILSVWDWSLNSKLYSINMDDVPLFITFSTLGNFIISCNAAWDSVKIYNAEDGSSTTYFADGFGIVSFAVFSLSEKNLMTYQPSGKIIFWDVNSNTKLKEIDTVDNLTSLTVTEDRQYLIGMSAENVVVIRVLDGQVVAKEWLDSLYALSLDRKSNHIVCLFTFKNKLFVKNWLFNDVKLQEIISTTPGIEANVSALAVGDDTIYLGDSEGTIQYVAGHGEPQVLSTNNQLSITGIDSFENTVALASAEGIILFYLKSGEEQFYADLLGSEMKIIANPLGCESGINFIDADHIAIWDKATGTKGISIYNIKSGTTERYYSGIHYPVTQVTVHNNQLLVLEENGQITILSLQDLSVLFQYFSPGMTKVVYVKANYLVGGKTQASQYSGSLLLINYKTGETVPISGPSLINFDLTYDSSTDSLYTLSIIQDETSIKTCIIHHSGKDYSEKTILYSLETEDLTAAIEFYNNYLYTSLGMTNLIAIYGMRTSVFEKSDYKPRKLFICFHFILSINSDDTITVWDLMTKNIVMHFFLFKKLGWVALFPQEDKFVSNNEKDCIVLKY